MIDDKRDASQSRYYCLWKDSREGQALIRRASHATIGCIKGTLLTRPDRLEVAVEAIPLTIGIAAPVDLDRSLTAASRAAFR